MENDVAVRLLVKVGFYFLYEAISFLASATKLAPRTEDTSGTTRSAVPTPRDAQVCPEHPTAHHREDRGAARGV